MGVITVLSQILLQTISWSSLQYLVQQNYPSLNSPAFWKGVFSWIYTLRLIFRYCSILRWYRLILPLFANIFSFSSSRTTETFPAIGICSPVYVFKFAFVFFSGPNFPSSSEYYAEPVLFWKRRYRVPSTVCGFPTQVNVDCDSIIFLPGHVVHCTDYRPLPLRRVRAENNWSGTKQWNQNLKDNLLCYF